MPEIRTIRKEELTVRVFDSRASMGAAAAEHAAEMIRTVAAEKKKSTLFLLQLPRRTNFWLRCAQ